MCSLILLSLIYSTTIVVFGSDTEAEPLLPNTTSSHTEDIIPENMLGKHESLKHCSMFTIESGEYESFPNGTIYVEPYNLTLNESHYILINGMVGFCVPYEHPDIERQGHVNTTSYLTEIGLGISMVCLSIHLIVFIIVPDLKNLPGCNLAALCASLLSSYSLIFVIGNGEMARYPDVCLAIAFLTHFFLLASVIWMSIISYDVYVSLLRATGSLRSSGTKFSLKKFGLYCLCAFGISLLFAVTSLLADILDVLPRGYKPLYNLTCWFNSRTALAIFFAGPAITLMCLNFIFFGLSACTLHYNKMKTDLDDQKSLLQRRYLMYFRLSVIMGITWIVGIVAPIVHVSWLWYVFVVLNTLQGFFVFIAFTCSSKVKKYFREKFFGARRGSQQTLSPTFQSYCFYANSIEKDMDKIVENEKEKTDTIMIHL